VTGKVAQVYVSGLPPGADEAALSAALAGVAVSSTEIVIDLETGEPRGYAVIRLSEEALEGTLRLLNGKQLPGGTLMMASPMPVTLPGEMAVRDWLHRNASRVFRNVGLKPGDRVLDYGCGPGIFAVAGAEVVGAGGKVYALDTRNRALEQVKERAAKAGVTNVVTLLQDPASFTVDLPGRSLDAVVIYDVLHDIADKPALLTEVARLLKPGGFLSVFPMHWGNGPCLKLVEEHGLFRLRDQFVPPNSKSPSHILNLVKSSR